MDFIPYENQKNFLNQTGSFAKFIDKEQSGGTTTGAFACFCHLTGEYPSWWEGLRMVGPCRILAVSETAFLTRDTLQKYICRFLHDRDFVIEKMRGIPNAISQISYGGSVIDFSSEDRGRERFLGMVWDYALVDNPRSKEVLSEIMFRSKNVGVILSR